MQLGPKVVRRRDKSLVPIVAERGRLLDSLLKLYGVIGLDRRARQVPDIRDWAAEKSEANS